jgi:rhodanese-related sulfurtransferase
LGELPQRLHELGPLRNERVVVVCHTDKRSAKAATTLSEAGFEDVRVLRGGMVRWTEARLPVADRLGEHRT